MIKYLKVFLLSGLVILLFSCKNEKSDAPNSTFSEIKKPFILDTVEYSRFLERNVHGKVRSDYTFFYIGKWRDTIPFEYDSTFRFSNYMVSIGSIEYRMPNYSGLIMIVDTTQIISDISYRWFFDDSDNNGFPEVAYEFYKSYPVTLINTSRDTLYVSLGEKLNIVMEAKDKSGNWLPIDEYYFNSCGTGLVDYFLPPNHIVVTKAPIYSGTFKTKLRLRYNNIVSNEFDGTINPTQFENEKRIKK